MTFLDVRNRLALAQEWSFAPELWPASQRRLPRAPFFLKPAYLREALEFTRMAKPFRAPLLREARRLAGNPALTRLAWHAHYALFAAEKEPKRYGPWDHVAPLFPAVVLLSGLPQLRVRYRKLGYPESLLVHTLGDLEIWLRDYQAKHGKPGFAQLGWLMYHYKARLFRLGRLQYIPKRWDGGAHLLRHRDGRELLVAAGGQDFRSDGQVNGSNTLYEEKPWTSRFSKGARAFIGHAITAAGAAQRRPSRFPRPPWSLALKPGDEVLDLHIAAGEPLELEACRASFAQADAFFGVKPKVCSSWLLDPTFAKALPPSSNIRAFQTLFHLFPQMSGDGEIFHRVFAPHPFNPAKLPRDSGLRRAILEHLDRGGQFIGGAGGVVRRDASRPGSAR